MIVCKQTGRVRERKKSNYCLVRTVHSFYDFYPLGGTESNVASFCVHFIYVYISHSLKFKRDRTRTRKKVYQCRGWPALRRAELRR